MFCRRKCLFVLLVLLCVLMYGCTSEPQTKNETPTDRVPFEPELPDNIRLDEKGVPVMNVYIADSKRIEEMDIESYLYGVLAGEMKNDWPLEALKAQAILARTFVIRFLSEKTSKYENADISTDIEEAQAYNEKGINERIKQAVDETRGLIVTNSGEPIYAWFHAHSGGKTANAAEGLSYKDEAPYTKSVDSMENASPAEDVDAWQAVFTENEILQAAKKAGVDAGENIESIRIGSKGESGRAQFVVINGKNVPANEFRISIGSTKMRSTLLSDISMQEDEIYISGKGYGHGVGMSQWGAYSMAEKGETAQKIIHHYFDNVDIVQKWF